MRLLALALVVLAAVGCSDAEMASYDAIGARHSVQLYSGGKEVRSWTSTGKIHNEHNSDGYYFCDEATGELVQVTGDLVVSPIED